jgi:glycosyltransferase involved in cell wall biosynthesis
VKLVASMIVKNELGRYLPECVGHLRDFCDLVVVLNDGSTDRTGEWLDDNSDERMVVQHLDPADGFFAGHEGRKRQALLDFTLKQGPDWVLAIDADEFVSDGAPIRAYLDEPRQIGSLEIEEVWKADNAGLMIRIDGGWRPHPIPCLWSGHIRERRGHPLQIMDRALSCGREPLVVRRQFHRARPTGASLLHFGWAMESGRRERYERYVTADGGRFHQNAHLDSIMLPDDKIGLVKRHWPSALKNERKLILEVANREHPELV